MERSFQCLSFSVERFYQLILYRDSETEDRHLLIFVRLLDVLVLFHEFDPELKEALIKQIFIAEILFQEPVPVQKVD